LEVLGVYFFDERDLLARADALADGYRDAAPFPHAVIDGLLPDEVARAVLAEFPALDDEAWFHARDYGKTDKFGIFDPALMGPNTRHIVNEFNAGPMIRFLERLTGIEGLVPDPHNVGGGLHIAKRGGYLDVHADFNVHPTLHLERRINVLLYLNPDWDHAWGGEFELWDRNLSGCAARFAPLFNRALIFNTTDDALHGHPTPLNCPPDAARRAIAFYYYTAARADDPTPEPHMTLYRHGTTVLPTSAFGPGGEAEPRVKRLQRAPRIAVGKARSLAGRSRHKLQQVIAPSHPTSVPAAPPAPRNHWELVKQLYNRLEAEGRLGRPNYTWPALHVGNVARTLGYEAFSMVEFGVAGGNGLLAMETAAAAVEELLGVRVEVHGFDTGKGLPKVVDRRDAPYVQAEGEFAMDEAALRARLRSAQLHLGLVRDTISTFIESSPAPVGFVSVDLDLYTSTMDALALFDAEPDLLMPRVLAYFDDIMGYPWGDSNGERRAIRDFNESHVERAIDQLHGLRYTMPESQFHAAWTEAMYLIHILDHPRYAEYEHTSFGSTLDLA
jgi:hypothetical protein